MNLTSILLGPVKWGGFQATLLGALFVLGSCQPGPPPETVSPDDAVDYFSQEAAWSTCDVGLFIDAPSRLLSEGVAQVECATVIVPASWDDLALGVDFEIHMMKLTAAPGETGREAIFINPGGPGGSGIEQVQNSEFPEDLLASFDVIGFDPRGVGPSVFTDGTSIKCSDELDYLSYFGDSSPASFEELQALVEVSDEYYLDCVEKNPLWWTLSTASVVKDLDAMRQAVTGDRPLNFIGSSYGTTIAGRYVTEFPDRVGKIVLDSPTTVSEDRIESVLQNLAANEAKLTGFMAGYAEASGLDFDEVWSRMLQIRQWADDGELLGFAGPEVSPGGNGQISSEALFHRGILTMNYLDETSAQEYFNQAIDQLWEERWNGVFEWFGLSLDGYDPNTLQGASLAEKTITRSNEYEVRVMVNSMDFAQPELTEEEQRELSGRAKEVAPYLSELSSDPSGYEYFGPRLGLSWSKLATRDPATPTPPDTPFIPRNDSGVELLVVGSINESVTPYQFARDTAELLKSPLISVESSLHAPVAYYTSECVNRVIVSFFTTATPIESTTCPG